MAYTFDEPKVGLLQIANTDAGVTMANGSSAIPTPPTMLGMVARAFDPTYGEGEFILLLGVASTVVGSCVTYSPTTYQTTLSPNTANLSQPLAVAMSANGAASFGWYQISGLAVVKKTAVKVDPASTRRMYQSATAGRLMQTSAAGKNILGMASANLTTVTSTTSTVVCSMNRPHFQGPIT